MGKILAAAVLVTSGGLMTAMAGRVAAVEAGWAWDGVRADAVVTDSHPTRVTTEFDGTAREWSAVEYAFRDLAGEERQGSDERAGPPLLKGHRVAVVYARSEPGRNRLEERPLAYPWGFAIGTLAIGLLALGRGAGVARQAVRSRLTRRGGSR